MITVRSKKELQALLECEREAGKTIALVPTMGALHQGHLSLVAQAVGRYDICVVSLFVNPTQFNNPQDLATYPRQPEQDAALLEEAGCHYLFMPTEKEMYPEGEEPKHFTFGALETVMEGVHRPGHFQGVALIVSKLFDLVVPDTAFFGEKDFQQIAIIRSMVEQAGYKINIIPVPIVREESGLALSSRNQRLTSETRPSAPKIYQTLQESKALRQGGKSPQEVILWVTEQLNQTPHLQVEYYEIVDAITLQPIKEWSSTPDAVGCIACYCGDVRLIDNIHY